MEILRCTNINKYYQSASGKEHVLKGVDFALEENKLLFIQGVSGSGKTTLLNILGLLDLDYAGDYVFCGENAKTCSVKQLEEQRNRDVAIIFQKYNLFPQFTVLENIMFPLMYRDIKLTPSIKASAEKILTDIGMLDYKEKQIHELSGGQQQRVAIGRSLLQAPKLLLADEPTANVDAQTEQIIMDLFATYKKTNTIVVVSHNSKYDTIADAKIEIVNGVITHG